MTYLKDFLTQIHKRDFHKFLVLWEEYCRSDIVEVEEFSQLLKAIKDSELSKHVGQIVETALPIWRTIQDKKESYEILRLLIDLQTSNSPILMEITQAVLQATHGHDPKFQERLRLAGLRTRENLQSAISRYDLAAHMLPGNFVFHTGGWGTGEIIEVSFVREHLVIEFERVSGRRDLSFANAFKVLVPLPSDHFLARRFSDADRLEQEGRDDPVGLIKLLLHDIGPKTAAEIKDELCELVIPEKDWTKWWQNARSKIKKDSFIETPDTLREPFYLRKAEITPADRVLSALDKEEATGASIQNVYSFVRDSSSALKDPAIKNILQNKLLSWIEKPDLSDEQFIQIYLLLEQFFGYPAENKRFVELVKHRTNIEDIVQGIDILAFKKRLLIAIKEHRVDWQVHFLQLFFVLPQAQLRDYLLKELNQAHSRPILENKIKELAEHPARAPELFVWYFQKILGSEHHLPYQSHAGRCLFLESFLILMSVIESQTEYRELVKKMYNMFSCKRYALVRELLQGTSLEFAKEFLLLASKSHSLSGHDLKILQSLVEVVHPSLVNLKSRKRVDKEEEEGELWATEAGYLKIQDRVKHIGTVEMIDNAREIEAARALGDLRENSEFKFAQERRARLQTELKTLSDQLSRARLITPHDIHPEEVSVGSVVNVADQRGQKIRYAILGPWEADPEQNILSFNSKLAKLLLGKRKGEKFNFKNEDFQILSIESYLKQ